MRLQLPHLSETSHAQVEEPHITTLTCLFFLLYLLCATQEQGGFRLPCAIMYILLYIGVVVWV